MKRWLAIGIPLILIGGLIYWRLGTEKAKAAEEEAAGAARRGAAPAVEIMTAASRPIIESIDVVGTVEAPYNVSISSKVSGRVTHLEVREGDAVKPGQIVARIDPSEAGAQVLEQQASLAEARSRLAQAQATSQANEVQIQSQIRQAKAGVSAAQSSLTQVQRSANSKVSAAESQVADAAAKVSAAEAAHRNKQAELKSAQATLDNAKIRLGRIQSQYEKGYVAAQEVDDAKTVVATAQADVNVKQGEVAAAKSAVDSAKAVKNSTEKNLNLVNEQNTADIEAAKAAVEQAKASLEQAEANRAQSPAYRENLNALRASVDAAEAQLRAAGIRQSDTELAAPFEGTVTRRTADPGSLATPGQELLQVQFLDWVFVTASVPVDQSSRVYEGQSVKIAIDAMPGKVYEGEISQISQSADSASRQFAVKVRLENPGRQLRPGMFARLQIVTQQVEPAVVLPLGAVADGKVTVLDGEGKAEIKPVETGLSDANGIEIKEGVEPGQKVIVLSFNPVRPGQEVEVVSELMPDGTRREIESPKEGEQ